MMSKTHQFKNAMRVYAAEYAAQEFRAFRLLNPCFAYIIHCATLSS